MSAFEGPWRADLAPPRREASRSREVISCVDYNSLAAFPNSAGESESMMPIVDPDMDVSLPLDAYAPRAARYYVARVDRPSPDLRDAVVLLTSELVTRAAQQCRSQQAFIELRAWMPADVVRVELRAPVRLLSAPAEIHGPDYSQLLLDQIADRWSLEDDRDLRRMWFEIDRHASPDERGPARGPQASSAHAQIS